MATSAASNMGNGWASVDLGGGLKLLHRYMEEVHHDRPADGFEGHTRRMLKYIVVGSDERARFCSSIDLDGRVGYNTALEMAVFSYSARLARMITMQLGTEAI